MEVSIYNSDGCRILHLGSGLLFLCELLTLCRRRPKPNSFAVSLVKSFSSLHLTSSAMHNTTLSLNKKQDDPHRWKTYRKLAKSEATEQVLVANNAGRSAAKLVPSPALCEDVRSTWSLLTLFAKGTKARENSEYTRKATTDLRPQACSSGGDSGGRHNDTRQCLTHQGLRRQQGQYTRSSSM